MQGSRLETWYQTPIGQEVANVIDGIIREPLDHTFGQSILYLGDVVCDQWLNDSRIPFKIIASDTKLKATQMLTAYDTLPLPERSVDLVICAHALEHTHHPETYLAELTRVLVPEGHMIIIGFNPLSFWGAARALHQVPAFHGRYFHRAGYVHYWLTEHGCHVYDQVSCVFRPPWVKGWRSLRVLETLGNMAGIFPGGLYVQFVRKETIQAIPIRPLFKYKTFVLGRQTAAPSAGRGVFSG